jgi:chemotaxis protein MotB
MLSVFIFFITVFFLSNFAKSKLHTNNMKKTFYSAACFLFIAVLFSSCIVSKKKYLEATARADKEHADNVSLTKQLADEKDVNAKLNGNITDLKSTVAGLNNRIAMLKDSISSLEGNVSDLNDKLSKLGNENQNTAKQLSSTKEQIAEQRKRLEQLQALIDQQKRATEALRKKIADALVGFNSNELTVTMKNGRVYISMQESLLFPSGSAEVNPKGNTSSDINIDVEGHTDSLPIHNKLYADNWALSTARATAIAHVLIDEYNVSPAKLIASGRSQYDPVAPNGTTEGRSLNRRTEIILEPKLYELMQLMDKK